MNTGLQLKQTNPFNYVDIAVSYFLHKKTTFRRTCRLCSEDPITRSKQICVQWTSGSNSTPVLLYGVSPNKLDYKVTGHWTTYKASDMCGKPANNNTYFIDPGYLHDVLLTDLKPNTLYYYQYGSDYIFSDIEQFTSAPPVGSDQSFKFVTYGDMGIAYLGAEVTAELVKQEINEGTNFVIHQGDLSYAVGYVYIST